MIQGYFRKELKKYPYAFYMLLAFGCILMPGVIFLTTLRTAVCLVGLSHVHESSLADRMQKYIKWGDAVVKYDCRMVISAGNTYHLPLFYCFSEGGFNTGLITGKTAKLKIV